MKKNALLILSFVLVAFTACNDDDNNTSNAVAAAFVNQTANISSEITPVNIVFSAPASEAGTVILNIETTNLIYGTDFTTNPAADGTTVTVPFAAGATSAVFTFTKLVDAIEGEVKNVKFTIASVSIAAIEIPALTNFTQLNFNETAMTTNTLLTENGGSTVPNQVYIDLSSGATTEVVRTSWDLGFYGGDDFRVVSNAAINKFAVKQLATTNIDEVQVADLNVTTGNYDATNMAYIDAPYGNLSGTAIAAIAANDADNKVYLVNLGYEIAAAPASAPSVALTGDVRGWKKIRITRSGNDYKLQYADIAATTHNEVIISKNAAYNFSFVSLTSGNIVPVEPQKTKWDINLTNFTGETFYGTGESAGSYYFPDFAVTNTKSGTRAYQVLTSETAYVDFTLANVVAGKFETDLAKDQRAIGSNWRATYPLALKTDRFYIVKDAAGNVYKLKFTAMQNGTGERGHIAFDYQLL